MAAHEAVHQLQHAGRIQDGGLGAELQAEAMGEAISAGTDPTRFAQGGDRVGNGSHPYTEIDDATQKANAEWQVGSTARVADNGMTVTTEQMHECYADPDLITSANGILAAKGSGISIAAGTSQVSGNAPDGSGARSLVEVVPTIATSTSTTGTQNLWTDCGRSSREVMGRTGTDTAPRGVYDDGTGTTHDDTPAAKNPGVFRDDIFMKGGLGTTPDDARKAYHALSDVDRDAFDKKHGLNRYAAPDVGEAYVSRRNDEALQPGDKPGFNFHWAGVIMVAGGDRVALENYARPGTTYDSKHEKWFFETHGPPTKPGQTFHEHYSGSVGGDVADQNVTMAATTTNHATTAAALPTRTLFERLGSNRAEEQAATLTELKRRKIHVTITPTDSAEWGEDELVLTVTSSAGTYTSPDMGAEVGDTRVIKVPLTDLVPTSGDFTVDLVEMDPFFDDTIGSLTWSSPFSPLSRTLTGGGGTYKLDVDFDR